MTTRRAEHQQLFAAMESTLLGPRGVAPLELRQAAMNGSCPADPALDAYVKKVRAAAYSVLPDELKALQARYTDDQLFDVTLCAGYGAAKERHDAGLAVLDAAWSEP